MERTKQRTKIKESTGERIFTGVIMFIAVSIIAISTGLITSAFSRVWQQENVFAHRRKRPADKAAADAGGEEGEAK